MIEPRAAAVPHLYRDRSFLGLTATQFLGAFNDNLFKQLMLLLAIKIGEARGATFDLQPIAMVVFALPFLLFSGYAGYLSDRHSKRTIIVLSKVAEIVVMLLGLVAFLTFRQFGFVGLMFVLLMMGTQSAFFGPGKYGILPEMLRGDDLPRANGLILMTTFLAIIFGTSSAGFFVTRLLAGESVVEDGAGHLWLASAACVGIAVLGTATSLTMRRVAASNPRLPFSLDALGVPADTRQMLRDDRPLTGALLASCVFWLVAGVAHQGVNSLSEVQLGLTAFWTSALVACIGIGIAAGAVLAGRLSHGVHDFRVMRVGAWGLVGSLVLLSIPGPRQGHLLGFAGSIPALIVLGAFAGMFAIPLQVFLQSRPPEGKKGRMIAVMNQANFAAILLAGPVYFLFDFLVVTLELERCYVFGMTAVSMLGVALWYRPDKHFRRRT